MAVSKNVSDYPDAVDRIVNSDVSPDSTTQEEIIADLRSADAPQITEEIANDIARVVVSEERVIALIEAGGELPAEGDLEAATGTADDYDMPDRQDAVFDAVRDRVTTTEDVSDAIRRERPTTRSEARNAIQNIGKELRGAELQDVADNVVTVDDVVRSPDVDPESGPVFREDVEAATQDMSAMSEIGDSEERLDAVTDAASREIGAPSENAFERAQIQAVGGADAVTPANRDDLSSESGTGISVIRDESGDPVAAFGGAEQGGVTPEETAQELGAERYYGTGTEALQQVQDDLSLEQGGGEAAITLEGRRLREVDVS